MDVTLQIHLEPGTDGSPVWWAESEELPGMTASADSLFELRELLAAVVSELADEGAEAITIVGERLAGVEYHPAIAPPSPSAVTEGAPLAPPAPAAPRQVLIPPQLALAA